MSNVRLQQQSSSPSNVGVGYSQIYAKDNGNLYVQTGTGAEEVIQSAANTVNTRSHSLSTLIMLHGGTHDESGTNDSVVISGLERVVNVELSNVVEYWVVGAGGVGGYHGGDGGGSGAAVHGFLDTTNIDQLTVFCASSSYNNGNRYWASTSCIRGYVSAGGGKGGASRASGGSHLNAGSDPGTVEFSTSYPGNTAGFGAFPGNKGTNTVEGNSQVGGAGGASAAIHMPYGNSLHYENTGRSGTGSGTRGDPFPVGVGTGGIGGDNCGNSVDAFKNGNCYGQHGAAGAVILIYNV